MSNSIVVGTSAIRLVEDADIPDSTRDATLKAVSHNTSIPTAIIQAKLRGIAHTSESYFKYGRDEFIAGLPRNLTKTTTSSEITVADIIAVVSAIEGVAVQAAFDNGYTIEIPDAETEALQYAHQFLDYDSVEQTVNPLKVGRLASEHVRITNYAFINGTDIQLTLRIGANSENSPLYIGHIITPKYLVLNVPVIKFIYKIPSRHLHYFYFTYATASNEFPSLGATLYVNTEHEYYPLAPIMFSGSTIIDEQRDVRYWETGTDVEPRTELSVTTEKLLGTLNIDMQSITDNINDNPDIDLISDVFIGFTVHINTQYQESIEYLVRLFQSEFLIQRHTKTTFEYFLANTPVSFSDRFSGTEMIIANDDKFRSSEFAQVISYHYITEDIKVGSIGAIGHFTNTVSLLGDSSFIETIIAKNQYYINNDSLILQEQLTATTYREMVVYGLRKQGAIDTPLRTWNFFVDLGIAESTETGSGGFYLPVSRNITHEVTKANQELFLMRSLNLVVQTVSITHLEFYETAAFAKLIKIASVGIAILSFSPQVVAITQALTSGAYILAASLVLELALTVLITSLVIDVLEWLVTEIGGDVALILSVIIITTAVAQGQLNIKGLPTALDLLRTVPMLTTAINNVAQDDMLELQSEISDFYSSVEEKQEELEAAYDLLNKPGAPSVYDLVQLSTTTIPEETPEDFFNRTIHSGNVGVLSLDMPSNYVDSTLLLPKF